MPPNLTPENGIISATSTTTTGTATATGCFIEKSAMRPNMPFSTSSRLRCRWNRLMPSESTRRPRRASTAGSRVTDSSAARITAAIAPYATDLRNACGKISSPDRVTPTMTAENTTVRPAVATDRRTATSGG